MNCRQWLRWLRLSVGLHQCALAFEHEFYCKKQNFFERIFSHFTKKKHFIQKYVCCQCIIVECGEHDFCHWKFWRVVEKLNGLREWEILNNLFLFASVRNMVFSNFGLYVACFKDPPRWHSSTWDEIPWIQHFAEDQAQKWIKSNDCFDVNILWDDSFKSTNEYRFIKEIWIDKMLRINVNIWMEICNEVVWMVNCDCFARRTSKKYSE